MNVQPVAHPSDFILKAFGSGKLDDAGSQAVSTHLEICPTCRARAANVSGDSFLERLRAARPHANTTPDAANIGETRGATVAPEAGKPTDSMPTTPHDLPSVPPELRSHSQYEILRELGHGGMGVVYLAKNKKMHRLEVLKVVNRQLLGQPGAVERFLREIRSAANLNHSSIVTAYSMPEAGDLLVFAMEYVPGEDLAKLVKDNGPLPVPNACFYVYQVAKGLQHAHEKKMVHRDIKPSNLIMTREGKKHVVKILDFGLAKATREEEGTSHELTGIGQMLGTPAFIAPEQTLDAAHADIRADIYSLGCTMYFLLTGRPPFQEKSLYDLLNAHHSKEAVPLNQLRKDVPPELAAVVAKMMAKQTAQRYQSPDEVLRALLPFCKATVKPLRGAPTPAEGMPPIPAMPTHAENATKDVVQKTRVENADEILDVMPANPGKAVPDSRQMTQVERLPQVQPVKRADPESPRRTDPSRGRAARTQKIPIRKDRSQDTGGGRSGKPLLWLLLVVILLGSAGAGAWYFLRHPQTEPTPPSPTGPTSAGIPDNPDVARAAFGRPTEPTSPKVPDNPDVARAAFGRPMVVLVGVDKCADNSIRGRTHPENDAKALYDLFTNRQYLGVASHRVRLLLGTPDAARGSQPATRENILAAVKWIADEAGPDDLVVFGFFGPGVPMQDSEGLHCYFASDTTSRGRARDAIRSSDIAAALKPLRSRRFCALLDVDFKAADEINGPAENPFGNDGWSHFLGSSKHTDDSRWQGRSLYVAANGLNCSAAAGGQGVFARALLEALHGRADNDGEEPDGLITNWELYRYLEAELAVGRKGGDDAPAPLGVFLGDVTHFALTENPSSAPAMKERIDKFTALAATEKEITAEIADEGKTLLSIMPRLEHQRRLRKKYQSLADGRSRVARFFDSRRALLADMELPAETAREFAEKVIEAANQVRDRYVKEVNQADLIHWAIRGLYRGMDEKMPNALVQKLARIPDMSEAERSALLFEVRRELGNRDALQKHKDIDKAVDWMLYRLDPMNGYYSPENLQSNRDYNAGQLTGIGVMIRQDARTDRILVATPIYRSPAYKAGIRAGDIITAIGNDVDAQGIALPSRQTISTKGMTTTEAIKKIGGKRGTRVTLTVERPGVEKPIDFTVERATIQLETALGFRRNNDDSWDHWIDPVNKIGYIRLTQFGQGTLIDTRRALNLSLHAEDLKGLILDLRFNSGGQLVPVRDIADLFIDDGLIYSLRSRGAQVDNVSGKSAGSFLNFPMACLVNGTTASGSEIVAACLQDYSRAKIIGERTYGKGSVQNIYAFEKKNDEVISELKLTSAVFYRPSNRNIDKSQTSGKPEDEWGVLPDKLVPLSWSEREKLQKHLNDAEIIGPKDQPAPAREFRDKQLDAALEFLRDQIRFAERGKK